MPSIAQIAQTVGVTRADVIRLLTEGGTTETDWRIAHEIEAAGGRRASELMLVAGRDHMIAEIWGDSGDTAQPPAPTNPDAEHHAEVRIYPEQTSPDETRQIAPHHPDETPEDDTPAARRERHQVRIWAAVASITTAPAHVVDRIVTKWTTERAVRQGLARLLTAAAPRRPRARRLLTTYVTAA